jgi:uncharacterized membrane protein YphA (DoxX/SURF4 family)
MSAAEPNRVLELPTVLARWFLGGYFIYMGLSKALEPVGFLKLVHQYQLTDSPFVLNFIAAALPWFEVFCGLLLIAGIGVRGTALIVVLMLVPFTIVVLHRALAIHALQHIPLCAVKFDCGCGNGEEWICRKIPENSGLIFLAAWLLAGRGRQWCLRYQLL